MNTRDKSGGFVQQWVRPLLVGTAVSVILCVAMLFLMAALVQSVDVPRVAVTPMAVAAAAVGAFGGGLTAATLAGRKGLAVGALCGTVLFLLILLAGVARLDGVDGVYSLLKLAVLIVTGGLGGVLGVNRRRSR